MTYKTQIEAYHLAEFCQLAQEKFLEGFTFDFKDNAHYPTSFGSFFSAVMVKQSEIAEQVQDAVEEIVQVQEAILEASVEALADATKVLTDAPAKGRPKKV